MVLNLNWVKINSLSNKHTFVTRVSQEQFWRNLYIYIYLIKIGRSNKHRLSSFLPVFIQYAMVTTIFYHDFLENLQSTAFAATVTWILLSSHLHRTPTPVHHRSCYYSSAQSYNLVRWFPSLFFTAVIFIFLSSDSDHVVSITRVHLDRLHIHTFSRMNLDITLDVTVKARNRDLYSIDHNSLIVSIAYQENQLGYIVSNQGHIKARGLSYIDATL